MEAQVSGTPSSSTWKKPNKGKGCELFIFLQLGILQLNLVNVFSMANVGFFFLAYPHSQVFLANPEFPDSKIPNLQQKHKHYHLHRLGVICSPPKKNIATAWLFFFASQQKKFLSLVFHDVVLCVFNSFPSCQRLHNLKRKKQNIKHKKKSP